MSYTIGQKIEKAIEIRTAVETIEQKHKDELTPYKSALNLIQNSILSDLQEQGLQNFTDQHGNCAYQHTRENVKVEDRKAFLDFVLAQNLLEMLSVGALIDPVREYISEHDKLPPGLKLDNYLSCKIRKG